MRGPAVLCGFYGRRNLGDDALLEGLVAALTEAGQPRDHVVLTPSPHLLRTQPGVRPTWWDGTAHGRTAAVRDTRLVRTILSRPHFVLGGGDLLRDSPTQDVAQVWLRPLRLAQVLRRRTAVVGVSVGELHRDDTRLAIRQTLDRCGLVTVRDQDSAESLRSIGVAVPVHVLPDLALNLTEPQGDGKDAQKVVVVCLRGLADRGSASSAAAHDTALDALGTALRSLPDDVAVQLVPLRSSPNTVGPIDDDYVAGLEFLARAGLKRRVDVVRHVPDPAALIEILGRASVVVGMRLHSLVLAVGLERPVVGLAYDRKVTGFLEDLGGQDTSRTLPEVTAGWLTQRLREAIDRGNRGVDADLTRAALLRRETLSGLLLAWN